MDTIFGQPLPFERPANISDGDFVAMLEALDSLISCDIDQYASSEEVFDVFNTKFGYTLRTRHLVRGDAVVENAVSYTHLTLPTT